MASLTWRQEIIWRDSETVWRHALTINPELDLAHTNLGIILSEQGKFDEAVDELTNLLGKETLDTYSPGEVLY